MTHSPTLWAMTDLPPLPARVHTGQRSRLVAYDHGAHLASWELDGEPVVWLSEHAVLDGTRGIRGGVPICFPWFANGPDGSLQPSHGLARTATWRPVPPREDEVWAWELTRDDVSGSAGAEHVPGDFTARYAVSLSAQDTLAIELVVTNPTDTAYQVEVALHTYLQVTDVSQVRLLQLEDADYWDKVTQTSRRQQDVVTVQGEVDRIYQRGGQVSVDDPGRRHILVASHGSAQTVVWNPGSTQARALTDLGDDEWREFICVETAAIGEDALTLSAGSTVQIGAKYMVRPYPAP